MSFTWTFTTGRSFLTTQMGCWPIIPGSLVIIVDDGNPAHRKVLEDDGNGNLVGDGDGSIDYSVGITDLSFTEPLPVQGTKILATYDPLEGGCNIDCAKCATNKLRLDITAGAISGQGDIAIEDAWTRLYVKIRRDVLPYHVELISDSLEESYVWSLGHRFDIIEGDVEKLDTDGMHLVFDSTVW